MVEGLSSGEGPVQNQDGRLTVKIADATYDRVETQTNATDMIGSSITSGGNVVVDAANDIMIEGSTLAAGVGADQTEQTLAVNNPNSGTHQADGVEQSAEYQTRLNSSHVRISYAVFCLKKKIYHTFFSTICLL